MACIVTALIGLSTTPRPPNRLTDPGSTCSAVTPLARAREKAGSIGCTECSAHTLAVFQSVDSLVSVLSDVSGSAKSPSWEWTSMMPGVTQRPCASITCAPVGATSLLPRATTFPFWSSRSSSSKRWPRPSSTTAPRISTSVLGAGR